MFRMREQLLQFQYYQVKNFQDELFQGNSMLCLMTLFETISRWKMVREHYLRFVQ